MTAEPLALFPADDAAGSRTSAPHPRRRRAPAKRTAALTRSTQPRSSSAPAAAADVEPGVELPRRNDADSRAQAPPASRVARLLLSPTEAAAALGISRSKLYELMRAGAVESVLIDTARRVPVDALEAYVNTLRAQRSD